MVLWLWMTLISGVLLGFYDIAKKKALGTIPLLNVLALYSLTSFLMVAFEFQNAIKIDINTLLLIALKSFIIFISWLLGFMAIRGLPISIITPFGTISPLFSIFLGIIVLNESLGFFQVIGLVVIFASYYFISKAGAYEVKGLFKNKYFYLMVGASLLSAASALIDKIALKGINVGQMQFWFSFFVALLYISALVFWRLRHKHNEYFRFSWFIPVMSFLLVLSDRIYFEAVKIPMSQISVIMPLRKVSIIVSAIIGGIIFREKNLKRKLICIGLLLIGVAILYAAK